METFTMFLSHTGLEELTSKNKQTKSTATFGVVAGAFVPKDSCFPFWIPLARPNLCDHFLQT